MSKERTECQHLDYADTLDGGVCIDCGATLGGGSEDQETHKASIACHECGDLFDGQQAECVCSYGGTLSLLCPGCYREEFGIFQGNTGF